MATLGARTVEEFCEQTSIGRTSAYKHAKLGQLIIRKIGRRSIILDSDAEAFLKGLPSASTHAPATAKAKRLRRARTIS